MATKLKMIQEDKAKRKSSTKDANDKLLYLMTYNQSITFARARTVQDLSDSCFDHLKSPIKYDTFATLMHGLTLSRQGY